MLAGAAAQCCTAVDVGSPAALPSFAGGSGAGPNLQLYMRLTTAACCCRCQGCSCTSAKPTSPGKHVNGTQRALSWTALA